jgi:hypothetical protein
MNNEPELKSKIIAIINKMIDDNVKEMKKIQDIYGTKNAAYAYHMGAFDDLEYLAQKIMEDDYE